MPDHVLKSSLLPKLLIKRNFNSPIFIYRPPINPKRFKIARSKMMASPSKTRSSGIRSCNDAIRSDSVALYRSPFVSFFSPFLDGVLNASSRAPPFCHASSSSRCVYLSIQPLSNHRPNIPRIYRRFWFSSSSSKRELIFILNIYIGGIFRQWNYTIATSWNLSRCHTRNILLHKTASNYRYLAWHEGYSVAEALHCQCWIAEYFDDSITLSKYIAPRNISWISTEGIGIFRCCAKNIMMVSIAWYYGYCIAKYFVNGVVPIVISYRGISSPWYYARNISFATSHY